MKEILDFLFSNQDLKYKEFNSNLTPNLNKDDVIGVRTPVMRSYAKKLYKESRDTALAFLDELPHKYFDENQLHAFILSEIKDYDESLMRLNEFLPYIDNWATCDQLKPKPFAKNKDRLLEAIKVWIKSEHTYTRRFAIEMLMNHYLDEDFDPSYLKMVSDASNEEYYVKMMIAWYFATALAKQYEDTIPYVENRVLPQWIHRKTITKSCESFRITDEQKTYLKSLRY